jgi:formylglycine-generating enzyme required for sulfatase activity
VRNGLDIRHASFRSDMDNLIRELKGAGRASPPVASVGAEGQVDAEPVQSAERQIKPGDGAPGLNHLISVVRRRWGWIAAVAAVLMIVYVGNYYKGILEDKRRADSYARYKSVRMQAEAKEAAQHDPASIRPGSGESFIDRLADGQPCPQCPEMVVVPFGKFTMGSPRNEPGRGDGETQVPVTISQPFAVGKFAVTFDQWDACLADRGCTYRPSDEGWGRGNRPIINVNWDDANAYAEWLSRKTGKPYRLLSEAEREYVTRADTATPFWWGSSITPKQANYSDNYIYGVGEYRSPLWFYFNEVWRWLKSLQQTVPVDTFEPNPWGLYNVHGNVWEWTADCWNESNQGNPGDGSARTTGDCTMHVSRGGSWRRDQQSLRAARRAMATSLDRNHISGFRVARTLNP